ncbi:hypothetical protein Tco_0532556 [Tanacetum coccineum]
MTEDSLQTGAVGVMSEVLYLYICAQCLEYRIVNTDTGGVYTDGIVIRSEYVQLRLRALEIGGEDRGKGAVFGEGEEWRRWGSLRTRGSGRWSLEKLKRDSAWERWELFVEVKKETRVVNWVVFGSRRMVVACDSRCCCCCSEDDVMVVLGRPQHTLPIVSAVLCAFDVLLIPVTSFQPFITSTRLVLGYHFNQVFLNLHQSTITEYMNLIELQQRSAVVLIEIHFPFLCFRYCIWYPIIDSFKAKLGFSQVEGHLIALYTQLQIFNFVLYHCSSDEEKKCVVKVFFKLEIEMVHLVLDFE